MASPTTRCVLPRQVPPICSRTSVPAGAPLRPCVTMSSVRVTIALPSSESAGGDGADAARAPPCRMRPTSSRLSKSTVVAPAMPVSVATNRATSANSAPRRESARVGRIGWPPAEVRKHGERACSRAPAGQRSRARRRGRSTRPLRAPSDLCRIDLSLAKQSARTVAARAGPLRRYRNFSRRTRICREVSQAPPSRRAARGRFATRRGRVRLRAGTAQPAPPEERNHARILASHHPLGRCRLGAAGVRRAWLRDRRRRFSAAPAPPPG